MSTATEAHADAELRHLARLLVGEPDRKAREVHYSRAAELAPQGRLTLATYALELQLAERRAERRAS